MRDMKKEQYESPELDIRWFESEDVITYSNELTDQMPSDGFGDEW